MNDTLTRSPLRVPERDVDAPALAVELKGLTKVYRGSNRQPDKLALDAVDLEIPRGTIYERNGIPVATGDWDLLQRHRAEYEALGVSLDDAVSRYESRHYPFGAATAHIPGDLRTGENFHATNASLVEHDSDLKLRGYRYEELAELVRYRHQPGNPGVARVLARDRDVYLTLDIRLQLRAQEIFPACARNASRPTERTTMPAQ